MIDKIQINEVCIIFYREDNFIGIVAMVTVMRPFDAISQPSYRDQFPSSLSPRDINFIHCQHSM